MGTFYIGDKVVAPILNGGGETINNQNKTITENGTYTADEGYTGLGTVEVNVEGGSSNVGKATLKEKQIRVDGDFIEYYDSSYGSRYLRLSDYESYRYQGSIDTTENFYVEPDLSSQYESLHFQGEISDDDNGTYAEAEYADSFEINGGPLYIDYIDNVIPSSFYAYDSTADEYSFTCNGTTTDYSFEVYCDDDGRTYYTKDFNYIYSNPECTGYTSFVDASYSGNSPYLNNIVCRDGIFELTFEGDVSFTLYTNDPNNEYLYFDRECTNQYDYIGTNSRYANLSDLSESRYTVDLNSGSIDVYYNYSRDSSYAYMKDENTNELVVVSTSINPNTSTTSLYFNGQTYTYENQLCGDELVLQASTSGKLGYREFYRRFATMEFTTYDGSEYSIEKFFSPHYSKIEIKNVTDLGKESLFQTCYNNPYIEIFSMPDLETLNLKDISNTFARASKIREINFDKLSKIIEDYDSSYDYSSGLSGKYVINTPNLEEINGHSTPDSTLKSKLNIGNKLRIINGYSLGGFDCSDLTEDNFAHVEVLRGSYPLMFVFRDKPGILINLDNVSVIGDKALSGMYAGTTVTELPDDAYRAVDLSYLAYDCKNLTTVDTSKLNRTVGNLNYSFCGCTSLTSLDLSLFEPTTSVYMNNAFNNCSNLTSVDLSGIKNIQSWESAFNNCYKLTTINLSSLERLSISIFHSRSRPPFNNCSSLETITFDKLRIFSNMNAEPFYNAFQNCSKLKNIFFPALTSTSFNVSNYNSPFYYMLYNVTGCTVHFPSNLSETFGKHRDFTNGFSGRNTVVLFDLPATE